MAFETEALKSDRVPRKQANGSGGLSTGEQHRQEAWQVAALRSPRVISTEMLDWVTSDCCILHSLWTTKAADLIHNTLCLKQQHTQEQSSNGYPVIGCPRRAQARL